MIYWLKQKRSKRKQTVEVQTPTRVLIRRRNQDTEESVPAYFKIGHKEIHFKWSFLPAFSPMCALFVQNLVKPLYNKI